MIYALDSNIVSYMLKDNDKVYARYIDALSRGNFCTIPLIVYYEVLRGLLANNAVKQMALFDELCADIDILSLDVPDMVTAANIYAYRKKRGIPIEDSDLLIAAQCVTNGYILVTNNAKHFTGIEGLQMVNWAK